MSERLFDEILEFLNGFKTAEDLAAECRHRGVRGCRGMARECLIAELTKAEFPEIAAAMIVVYPGYSDEKTGFMSVVWETPGSSPRPQSGELRPLPGPVRVLALEFDRGKYPDLVKPARIRW